MNTLTQPSRTFANFDLLLHLWTALHLLLDQLLCNHSTPGRKIGWAACNVMEMKGTLPEWQWRWWWACCWQAYCLFPQMCCRVECLRAKRTLILHQTRWVKWKEKHEGQWRAWCHTSKQSTPWWHHLHLSVCGWRDCELRRRLQRKQVVLWNWLFSNWEVWRWFLCTSSQQQDCPRGHFSAIMQSTISPKHK